MESVTRSSARGDQQEPSVLVYTDFDGTLLGRGASVLRTSAGEPTVASAQGLVDLYRAGARVIPVSGRNSQQLLEASRLLSFSDFICELGSEITYDLGSESDVVAFDFAPAEAREVGSVADYLRSRGVEEALLERFHGFLEPHTPWASSRKHTLLYRGLRKLPNGEDLAQAVVSFLETEGFDWLTFFDNGPVMRRGTLAHEGEVRAFHLLPRGVNKAVAVARHRARFPGVPAFALGNSAADLVMAIHVDAFYFFGDEKDLSAAADALLEASGTTGLDIRINDHEAVINGKRVLALCSRGPEGFAVASKLILAEIERGAHPSE